MENSLLAVDEAQLEYSDKCRAIENIFVVVELFKQTEDALSYLCCLSSLITLQTVRLIFICQKLNLDW